MPIRFTCPNPECTCELMLKDELAGKRVKCPRCGKILTESSATAKVDSLVGKKFAHYRTLDALAEYLLVAQDAPRVEQYVKQPDGDWLLHEATRLDEAIVLPTIRCELRLAEVYDGVDFGEGEQKV